MAELERRGFTVTYIEPEPGGWVSPDAVIAALRPGTLLVSIMHVNNETGVLQPIAEIAEALQPTPPISTPTPRRASVRKSSPSREARRGSQQSQDGGTGAIRIRRT
jgi:hypothetical protein